MGELTKDRDQLHSNVASFFQCLVPAASRWTTAALPALSAGSAVLSSFQSGVFSRLTPGIEPSAIFGRSQALQLRARAELKYKTQPMHGTHAVAITEGN